MSKVPQKYYDAQKLLKADKQDEFLAFEDANKLDYDIAELGDSAGNDDTLLRTACTRKLWRAVAKMLERGATPSWIDLARTYGYADEGLSALIWTKYNEWLGRRIPLSMVTVRLQPDDEHFNSLLGGLVYERAHISLLKKVVSQSGTPNNDFREDFHGSRYPVATALLRIDRPHCMWNPAAFIWLCTNFRPEQLNIKDDALDLVLDDWGNGRLAGMLNRNADDDKNEPEYGTADDAERVFWLVEGLYQDKAKFRQRASRLVPTQATYAGAKRLVEMLAACGVRGKLPELAEAVKKVEKRVQCPTCAGTGHSTDIDEELVQQAKKRRQDAAQK